MIKDKEHNEMIKIITKNVCPTMLAVTLAGLYSVIDGWFIGTLAGDVGLAAINFAWPITAIITSIGTGIGIGGSILFSCCIGKNEKKEAMLAYETTLSLLVLLGIVLFCILQLYPLFLSCVGAKGEVYKEASKYCQIIVYGCIFQVVGTGILPILRNINMQFQAMLSMSIGLVINIIIHYLTMMQYGLGIRGAAIGTVCAQFCVMIINSLILLKKSGLGIHFTYSKTLSKQILKNAITPFGISMAPSITLIFTNWQCIRYGGEAAVACYAVISYIMFPVQNVINSIGDGTQPLISFYYGADKKKELLQILKISKIILFVLGIIFTTTVIGASPLIGDAFGLSKEGLQYFSIGIKLSSLSFILVGFMKYRICYLNATMNTKQATIYTYLECIIINPIYLLVFPFVLNVEGIWMCSISTVVTMLLINYCIERADKSNKT